MSVRTYLPWFVGLGGLALAGELQGWLAHAATISGTAVTLSGLDNFAATIQEYAKGNVGKMVGMVIAMAGIAMVVAQKMGLGLVRPGRRRRVRAAGAGAEVRARPSGVAGARHRGGAASDRPVPVRAPAGRADTGGRGAGGRDVVPCGLSVPRSSTPRFSSSASRRKTSRRRAG